MEEEFCTCGGQWCGCEGCQETAQDLRSGRRGEMPGIKGRVDFWCEETGIRRFTAQAV